MSGYDTETAYFDYFLQLKLKNFAHSRIFKDRNQIQGLSRAWNFLLPIPGLSRILRTVATLVLVHGLCGKRRTQSSNLNQTGD